MKMFDDKTDGRHYAPYGLDIPTARPGRIRWMLSIIVIIVMVALLMLHQFIMQPYAVVDGGGDCVFVVQPTDWNEGVELPCGSVQTYGFVTIEAYRG